VTGYQALYWALRYSGLLKRALASIKRIDDESIRITSDRGSFIAHAVLHVMNMGERTWVTLEVDEEGGEI